MKRKSKVEGIRIFGSERKWWTYLEMACLPGIEEPSEQGMISARGDENMRSAEYIPPASW